MTIACYRYDHYQIHSIFWRYYTSSIVINKLVPKRCFQSPDIMKFSLHQWKHGILGLKSELIISTTSMTVHDRAKQQTGIFLFILYDHVFLPDLGNMYQCK